MWRRNPPPRLPGLCAPAICRSATGPPPTRARARGFFPVRQRRVPPLGSPASRRTARRQGQSEGADPARGKARLRCARSPRRAQSPAPFETETRATTPTGAGLLPAATTAPRRHAGSAPNAPAPRRPADVREGARHRPEQGRGRRSSRRAVSIDRRPADPLQPRWRTRRQRGCTRIRDPGSREGSQLRS